MTSAILTERAEADLQDIHAYTRERWGETQAETYLRQLFAVSAELANGQRKGRSIAHVRPGLFLYNARPHILFFEWTDTGNIRIIRVLHERMDFARHL